jgi:hypothetical protein
LKFVVPDNVINTDVLQKLFCKGKRSRDVSQKKINVNYDTKKIESYKVIFNSWVQTGPEGLFSSL